MEELLKYSRILVSVIIIPISIITLYINKMFNIVWLLLAILNGISSLEYYVKNKKISAGICLATCIIIFLCFIQFITMS